MYWDSPWISKGNTFSANVTESKTNEMIISCLSWNAKGGALGNVRCELKNIGVSGSNFNEPISFISNLT